MSQSMRRGGAVATFGSVVMIVPRPRGSAWFSQASRTLIIAWAIRGRACRERERRDAESFWV